MKFKFCSVLSILLFTIQLISQKAPRHITTVEGLKEFELENGLRVLLAPDPAQSNLVVNIVYKVGSRHEGYGETGMAHLLEHMLFKQCKKFTDIKKAIADKGAFANGTTWYDRTNYYEILSASDENLKWALDMEADRMVNSKILEEELKKEFSVVRNEFEIGENNQSAVLNERVISAMYLWHNYGNSTIGSREDIERVNVENLRAFYRKYYQPDNAVLVIAGKFDEQKALEYTNEFFSAIPRPGRKLQPTYTVEPPQDGERVVTLRRTGDIQYIGMGYHTPCMADKDYAPNDALIEILTNNPSGILYKKLVDKKLATKVGGYAQTLHDPGFTYFEIEVPKDQNLDSTKKVLIKTMDELGKMDIKEEDLIRAMNTLLKNVENTNNNIINLSIGLTEFIGAGDWRLWFQYRDRVENLKLDDVKNIAKKYYLPSNRTLGVFLPESTTPDRTIVAETPDIEKMLEGYKGKIPVETKAEFENSIDNIAKNTEYGSFAPEGKYALLQKPAKGDKINATLTLKWGSEAKLQSKQLIASLTAQMLKKGTTSKSKSKINDELDRLKSSINLSGLSDRLNININTEKKYLKETLMLLDDLLKNPSFDTAEFSKLIIDTKANTESAMNDPQTVASEKLDKLASAYPRTHPLYQLDSKEKLQELSKIKIADLKSYYSEFYGANNSYSAFLGELDLSCIKDFFKNTFSTWKSKTPYAELVPKSFETKETKASVNTPDKTNAMMLGQLNININEKHPDFAATYMANELLGGGAFLSSRIPQRLRENEGMSYGAGSFLNTDYKYTTGSWGLYAFFNPIYQNRLDSALNQEIDKALMKGFTQDELTNAVNSTLQQNKTLLGLNNALGGILKSYMMDGRNLSDFIAFETKLKALKLDDVNNALKKYFNKSKLIKVYAGDFEKINTKPPVNKS